MIKKIALFLVLLVCSVCFSVELDKESLNNYSDNFSRSKLKGGEVLICPKVILAGKNKILDFEFNFAPRISIEKNVPQIQLLYIVNKGYPDFFEVVFRSGKTLQLKLHDKLRLEGEGNEAGLVFYRSKFLISSDQYYTYFIKDTPVKMKVKIPGFFNGEVYEIDFPIEMLKPFRDMKIFFKE